MPAGKLLLGFTQGSKDDFTLAGIVDDIPAALRSIAEERRLITWEPMRTVNAEEVFVKGALRDDIRINADLEKADYRFDDWIVADPLAKEQRPDGATTCIEGWMSVRRL
jgi:hypothetical protein